MTASVTEDSIVLTCAGVELLRARAELYKLIGDNCKSTRSAITVPIGCADVVMEAFPDLSCEGLSDRVGELLMHRHAVTKAKDEFSSLCTDRIPDWWREVLDIPQQYAVNAMICPGLRGACLFDEQGTGKTIMALAVFDILESAGTVERAIVVSPKSMTGGWANDIRKFTGGKFSLGIIEGSALQKRQVVSSGNKINIVNYEGVDSVLVPLEAFARQSSTMLIVDESYYVKNPETNRAALLSRLRPLCSKCYVLCGTPAPRSAYDIISQVNLADNNFAFASFSKTSSEDSDRERIADILQTRALTIRRLKQEVLKDVPGKNFEIVRVPLTGRQLYMYQKARDELVVELRSIDNRIFKKRLATYFQKRATLLEICAVPKMVDPLFIGTSAKLTKLQELVTSLVAQQRKVLIWTCYRDSVAEISTTLHEYSPLIIDGTVTSGKDRAAIVSKFQTDPSSLVLIANPAAAGAGITLHAAHDAIYYSYTNQAAHYLQSLDRIHRRGQTSKSVTYYMIVCEGTIEENEVVRLRQRELAQHDLLGDVVEWPASIDMALAELTSGG